VKIIVISTQKNTTVLFFIGMILLFPINIHANPTAIKQLLNQCQIHLSNNDLTSGRSGNALACFNQVLVHNPDNLKALNGLKKIEQRFLHWAEKAIQRGRKNKLAEYIEKLTQINPKSPHIATLQQRFQNLQEKNLSGLALCESFFANQ
jgi:hypothetical protein